ncbi:MAG: MbcA/ParS/Xre antitoxin family protein [Gammaproteobacteria bacterium]|nr:MbcA/ParS/Xre antitoxin family protein [Gammaproteobacteria bacterium]
MSQQALFENVYKSDPLEFWSNHGLDYKKVTDFLDFNTNELSKIGGVSKRSVRLDDRIPNDLKERLEQIANICAIVAGYFEGDVGKTALWFKTPNPMLGYISPRDMIRFGRYKRLLKFITESQEANLSSATES